MILLLYLALLVPPARLQLDHSYGGNINDENTSWTDSSPRPRIKNSNYLMDMHRYPMNEYPGGNSNCTRKATCIPLTNATCMGAKLPYDSTTLDFFPEYITQEMIREKLRLLQALKHIPKCWAVVQPFLCSLFMPRCVNNLVDLPSQEMCKAISSPCRILFNQTIWPNFIKCEDTKLFPSLCKNDLREIKFNTSGKCLSSLVPTDNALAVFEGIDGCGTPCSDPLYTQDEQKQIHSFIAWAAGICLFFNLFAMITFMIEWKGASKYPACSIFYVNLCFMVSCMGWLAQYIFGTREGIVCRKDGTLRMNEPSGESLSCVVVFVLVYYSLLAATVWFMILTYTWHHGFQKLGKIQDRQIDKKEAYFHLVAWCLPLILTVVTMGFGEIDGNYTLGICFVGYRNHVYRTVLLLIPVVIMVLTGQYFLVRGLITLIRLKMGSKEIISERASSKIRETIVRMGLFTVFTFVAVIVAVYCHIYEVLHSWEWKQSYRDFIICSIMSTYLDVSECKMEFRPSPAKLQLYLLAPFFAGILMASLVWTSSTVDTWIRFFRRIFNREVEEPVKLKKHKVIAQAFAKRKMFNNTGRLSISFRNTHQDPVGLNFDLNSVASQDFSSTWAAALPKLVTRRGALVGCASETNSRRNSTDSQISVYARKVSVESRRNSFDSQFAYSISEIKAEIKKNNRSCKSGKRSGKKSKSHKRGRRNYEKKSRSHKMLPSSRRGSTTSQESQFGLQIVQSNFQIGAVSNGMPIQNMRRRQGLNDEHLVAGKLLPFLFPNQSDSDENSSSEEIQNEITDKDVDVEAGTRGKNDDSEDDDD